MLILKLNVQFQYSIFQILYIMTETKKDSIKETAIKLVDDELKEIMKMRDDYIYFVENALQNEDLKKFGGIDARFIISQILSFQVDDECDHPSDHIESIFMKIKNKMKKSEEVDWNKIYYFFDDVEDETENKIIDKWGQTIVNKFVHLKEIPMTRLGKHQEQIYNFTMHFIRSNKDYLTIHCTEEFDEEAYDHILSLITGSIED